MSDHINQIREIFRRPVANIDDQVRQFEEAIQIADSHNDVRAGMQLRMDLIRDANDAGLPEKILVAFSWCLAQFDRNPEFSGRTHSLLWYYKWIANSLGQYAQISRKQIDDTFADMQRRYAHFGESPRPIYCFKAMCARYTGDMNDVRPNWKKWLESPRDSGSDCPACEADNQVTLLLMAGEEQQALAAASGIIEGRMKCREVPELTFSRLLVPLIRLDKLDLARFCHEGSIQRIMSERSFVASAADHLRYLVLVDQTKKAIALLEATFGWALELRRTWDRFQWIIAARLLLKRLIEKGQTQIQLRLPPTVPMYRPDGTYDVAELASWAISTSEELARQFNVRNGNSAFDTYIAENDALLQLVKPAAEESPGMWGKITKKFNRRRAPAPE